MQRTAVLVSALLHPLIMPLACVFVAYKYDWYVQGTIAPDQIRWVYLIIALSTIAFPGINILLLRWYGFINSLEMPTRSERLAPFLSTAFFFMVGYYMLRKGVLPDAIYSILIGCILALLIITIISFFWKISAHATGVFGLLGTTIALFELHNFGNIGLLSIILIFGGAVLTSRLVLKAHTQAEIYAGAAVGFSSLYFCVANGFFI